MIRNDPRAKAAERGSSRLRAEERRIARRGEQIHTMRWWWQSRSDSSQENTAPQRRIAEWAESLEHPSEDRQRKAAERLAVIGHPLAVRWSLNYITKRECAEWGVRLLEKILDGFTTELDAECLREVAAMADPLQKIPPDQVTRHGKPLRGTWETYRAIDCSLLRHKAQAELRQRAAGSAWTRLVNDQPDRRAVPQQSAV